MFKCLKNIPVTFYGFPIGEKDKFFQTTATGEEIEINNLYTLLEAFDDAAKIYKDKDGNTSMMSGWYSTRLFDCAAIALVHDISNNLNHKSYLVFWNEGDSILSMAGDFIGQPVCSGVFTKSERDYDIICGI